MKIINVTTELSPFCKFTRYADNIKHLIFSLKLPVHTILPYYSELQKFESELSFKNDEFEVFKVSRSQLSKEVFFIKPKEKFFVKFSATELGFEQTKLFSNFVIEFLLHSEVKYDIIHCHNWETGLLPLLIKNSPDLKHIKSLFSFANIDTKGSFQLNQLEYLETNIIEKLQELGNLSLLKTGVFFADKINTCSRKYSQEIQTNQYGQNLDPFFLHRNKDLYGIINGVDYGKWNPEKDDIIPKRYSINDLSGKKLAKSKLQEKFSLPQDENIPLLIFGRRLIRQKGIELLLKAIPQLSEQKIQLIIYGTGNDKYTIQLNELMKNKYSNIRYQFGFEINLAHLIIAGGDFVLLPSYYEPGGVSSLFALKYGTIPIARKIGSFVDVIFDSTCPHHDKINGFFFNDFSVTSFLQIINEAKDVYKEKAIFKEFILNAMNANWSWKFSALQYLELYNKLL